LRENHSFIFFLAPFIEKHRGQIEAVLLYSESYVVRQEQ